MGTTPLLLQRLTRPPGDRLMRPIGEIRLARAGVHVLSDITGADAAGYGPEPGERGKKMTTQQHRFAWTFAVSCTLVVGLMACSDSAEDGTEATQRAASTTATAPSSELGTSTTTGPSPVTDQQVDDTTTTETALEVTTTAAHIGKPPSPTTTHQAAVGPPSVMSAPIVVETTNSAVTIAFVEADSSGPAVDEYEVAAGSGQAVGCAMSPCTITGLTNGVSYKFRVRAHNSVGWSDWSSWSLPCSPFGVPRHAVGTSSGPGRPSCGRWVGADLRQR